MTDPEETFPPDDGPDGNEASRAVISLIRQLRQRRGWSVQRLSEECHRLGHPVTRAVLANAEVGRRASLSVDELMTLAAALDVPAADLLHAEHTPETVRDQEVGRLIMLMASNRFITLKSALEQAFDAGREVERRDRSR